MTYLVQASESMVILGRVQVGEKYLSLKMTEFITESYGS